MTTIVNQPLSEVLAEERRFGRRQVTGIIFAIAGVALMAFVAPNITSDTRTFAFEPPPDPLEWSFNPQTIVVVFSAIYIVAGGLSFLPERYDQWAKRAQMLAAAVTIPLILAIALGLSDAPATNVTNLLDESLVLATPIALGAMTGLWSERVGIINIGIEGTMLGSAGVGFMVFATLGEASSTGWLWVAILVSVITGGLLALLLAVLAIRYGINQIVAGVVINLFALGLTGFLRSEVIVPSGNSKGISTSEIGIPLLEQIPILSLIHI